MREILFRGKRNNGDWCFGNLFIPDKKDAPTEICIGTNVIRITYDVIPETVGQYTGLTDKNGKKIFEGDIVEYTEFYKFSDDEDLESAEERNETIAVVKFVNGRFTPLPTRRNCEDYWYSYAEDNFKIIGNIHDNPELLKGGAE